MGGVNSCCEKRKNTQCQLTLVQPQEFLSEAFANLAYAVKFKFGLWLYATSKCCLLFEYAHT